MGAFERALDNIDLKYTVIISSEIDKYVSKAYSIIHNITEDKNLGDINNININDLKRKNVDLMTWGFPCQNFSVANRNGQKGLKGKQSGLYYKGLEVLKKIKPKVSVIENVNSLKGEQLEIILKDLKKQGYTSYYKVLDSQDFGIPQRRKRLFIVSFLKNIQFSFPNPKILTKDMGDYLLDDVNEKYYKVNPSIIDKIKQKPKSIKKGNNQKLVCNTLTKAIARQGSSKEFILNCSLIYTLTNEIRRITPLECWRLMGFEDKDYYNTKKELEKEFYYGRDRSDTRMYNMAANSIAVPVLEEIFKSIYY